MPKLPACVIVAQHGYQDQELDGVLSGLKQAGIERVLASANTGTCTGKFGGSVESTIALKDVRVASYDRIAFIGGPGAAALTEDAEALRIARESVAASIPLGAICIAPLILAKAKVLTGRNATVWDDGARTQIQLLERDGAHYTEENVTIDGVIVTGNGPKSAVEFGRKFARIPREEGLTEQ